MNFSNRISTIFVLGALLFLLPAAANSEIYKWIDERGQVHFQDYPPQDAGQGTKLDVRPSSPRVQEPTPPPRPAAGDESSRLSEVAPAEPPAADPKPLKVELYTVSWCPWCRKAREFFHSRGVSFTDYDIEKDPSAAARKARLDSATGVPFAIVNGTKIHGYSPEAYARALEARRAP